LLKLLTSVLSKNKYILQAFNKIVKLCILNARTIDNAKVKF